MSGVVKIHYSAAFQPQPAYEGQLWFVRARSAVVTANGGTPTRPEPMYLVLVDVDVDFTSLEPFVPIKNSVFKKHHAHQSFST
jgi:hypothetical protein